MADRLCRMRTMNLPQLHVYDTLDLAVQIYRSRVRGGLSIPLECSPFLIAYMAWPNDEQKRNSWIASIIGRSWSRQQTAVEPACAILSTFGGLAAISDPVLEVLVSELLEIQKAWEPVADLFLRIVDMTDDPRLKSRAGASISKAISLCENDKEGRSPAQLYRLWKRFHDVAHLIAAGAILASNAPEGEASRSIFSAVWHAPDVVVSIGAGFEIFGLSQKSHGRTDPVLSADTVWHLPPSGCPQEPFLVKRLLSEEQVDFLNARRSAKRYLSKP
jgi:hypothetical protein